MKRLLCKLWGCYCSDTHDFSCPRCGAALYDADFVQIGRLEWVYRVRDFFRGKYAFITRRCDVCRKRMWFTRHNPCCSEKCYDQWLPF